MATKKAAAVNTAVDPGTGVNLEDLAAIKQSQLVAEAEQKIAENAPPENTRYKILKEIRVDQFTVIRKYVDLTPSMCQARGCGYDAAKELGYVAGWDTVPHDQRLPNGRNLGEAIIGALQYHNDTAHMIEQSHIKTVDEVNAGKQWSRVAAPFLTNPARA